MIYYVASPNLTWYHQLKSEVNHVKHSNHTEEMGKQTSLCLTLGRNVMSESQTQMNRSDEGA
jgi:hypothetical protein